jgi:hypothetical protein
MTPRRMFYASISTRLFLVRAFLRMGRYEEARRQFDLSKDEIARYGTHATVEDLLAAYNAWNDRTKKELQETF